MFVFKLSYHKVLFISDVSFLPNVSCNTILDNSAADNISINSIYRRWKCKTKTSINDKYQH